MPSSLTVMRRPRAPTVTAIDTARAPLCDSTLARASLSAASTPAAVLGGTSAAGSAHISTVIPVRCDHSARQASSASARLCPSRMRVSFVNPTPPS